MSGGGVIPQPVAMSIDPERAGMVIVMSRDGRYLQASFGGTPWTDIHPRSSYLLSTCVTDRAFAAPIVRRTIDISGCEVSRLHRQVIAQSAIPTIAFDSFFFVFGAIVLPHVDRALPLFIARPPVFGASTYGPNVPPGVTSVAPLVAAGARLPGSPSTSATGPTGTVVVNGGNVYTFQWRDGTAWMGGVPLYLDDVSGTPAIIPPGIGKSGVVAAEIVVPPSTFNVTLPDAVSHIFGNAGAPSFVHGSGAVPIISPVPPAAASELSPIILPTIRGSGRIAATFVQPRSAFNFTSPNTGPPIINSMGAPAFARGPNASPTIPHVQGAPGAYGAVVHPDLVDASLTANVAVPRAPGTIVPPMIVAQPAFDSVFGPVFNSAYPVPDVASLVASAIRSPIYPGPTFSTGSIASPLYLSAAAFPSFLPKGSIASGTGGPQPPAVFGWGGRGTIWNQGSAPLSVHAAGNSGVRIGAAPGYDAHAMYASSFHAGLSAYTGQSPVFFGQRR